MTKVGHGWGTVHTLCMLGTVSYCIVWYSTDQVRTSAFDSHDVPLSLVVTSSPSIVGLLLILTGFI
jgi:hypothetical protein